MRVRILLFLAWMLDMGAETLLIVSIGFHKLGASLLGLGSSKVNQGENQMGPEEAEIVREHYTDIGGEG